MGILEEQPLSLLFKVIKVKDKEGSGGGKPTSSSSTPSGHRYFKCHGLGHIAFDCPNRRVITFVEEEEDVEEETVVVQQCEEEEEVAYADQGMAIVVHRNLKVFDCPNRRVIAFVEEEDDVEEETVVVQECEEEEEVAYADQGKAIVVQCNLKVSCVVEDKNWVRKNVFHTKCTSHGKVCMVIINSGSFENDVSFEMV